MMIQINTLYTLENVCDFYYICDDYTVINKNTNQIKKVTITKRGYPIVTLQLKYDSSKNLKVPMHKIIALAFIKNEPYELIEHINDNKLDYRVENLKFSNRMANAQTAKKFGAYNKVESIYKIKCLSGEEKIGTIKELAKQLNAPRITLYDIYYNNRVSKKYNIKSIELLAGQQTVER